MKLSEVTFKEIKKYGNIEHDLDDDILEMILKSTLAYILNYTGLSLEETEDKEDLSFALFILANELYENRTYTVENEKINPFVKSVLNMHSINLL